MDCPPTGLVVVRRFGRKADHINFDYDSLYAEFSGLELTPELLGRVWTLYPLSDSTMFLEHGCMPVR